MVRGRGGHRGGDGPAHRGGVGRLGGEIPHGPALRQHVRRAEPEHVLGRRPDQRRRARAVRAGDQPGQAAHDRGGHLAGLALDQVAGRGDLVGHGGDRDLQRAAEGVGLAPVVAQRGDARRADRGVGLAVAPGTAHGVSDHHPDGGAGALGERPAQPPGRVVRVAGQQHDRAGRGIGFVHPGGGQDQAVPGLRDPGRPAAGDHPDRLGVDGRLPVHGGDPALGLADDLRGDDQDVAAGQPGGRGGDQGGQVGPGGDLRQPGHRQHGHRQHGHRRAGSRLRGPQRPGRRRPGWAGRPGCRAAGHRASSAARSRAARAISAVAARSVMYSGRARTAIGASPGSSAASLSWLSTSQPSSRPGP